MTAEPTLESCECQSMEAGPGGEWLAAYGLFAKAPFDDWKKGTPRYWQDGGLVHHPRCETRWRTEPITKSENT